LTKADAPAIKVRRMIQYMLDTEISDAKRI
jgi:hypothetical protein